MSTNKNMQHLCSSCRRETKHEILQSHETVGDSDYRIDVQHFMLKCRGCDTIGFLIIEYEVEAAFPIDDNEWHVPETKSLFPTVLKGHQEIENLHYVPIIVKSIYTQSLKAITDGLNILAGIGLRTTLEAICIEQGVAGKTLDKSIDTLFKNGLISRKDTDRLHSIRFMGNDATHEIKSIDTEQLRIALRIIETLLTTIYILDQGANLSLDTIISTPERFLILLNEKLRKFNNGDEVPLAGIFGKDMRRFHGHFQELETDLIAEMRKSNSQVSLKLGKLDFYSGSKDKKQHFVVNKL